MPFADRRLILVRHAATELNAERRFLSYTDAPLSQSGRDQLPRLRSAVRAVPYDRSYCSPALRCRETLAAIQSGGPAPVIEPAIREICYGAWEGLTAEDVDRMYPNELAERDRAPATYRPPGGESFTDVAERVVRFLDMIAGLGGSTLIVSHRGTLGVVERLWRGLPIGSRDVSPLEPAEIRIVDR